MHRVLTSRVSLSLIFRFTGGVSLRHPYGYSHRQAPPRNSRHCGRRLLPSHLSSARCSDLRWEGQVLQQQLSPKNRPAASGRKKIKRQHPRSWSWRGTGTLSWPSAAFQMRSPPGQRPAPQLRAPAPPCFPPAKKRGQTRDVSCCKLRNRWHAPILLL